MSDGRCGEPEQLHPEGGDVPATQPDHRPVRADQEGRRDRAEDVGLCPVQHSLQGELQ